jgi:hypothetical protein
MKSSLFSRIILATLALALATSAFAANDTHKNHFEISIPAQVNGTVIPPGDYVAKWEGAGPTVQVSIMDGKKVLATVQAQVVTLSQPASASEAELTKNSSGGRDLTSLQFSGKTVSLQIGAGAASGTKAESTN